MFENGNKKNASYKLYREPEDAYTHCPFLMKHVLHFHTDVDYNFHFRVGRTDLVCS